MSEMVKCGWRNCDKELELIPGAAARYCTPSHKQRASAARNKKPSTPEQVAEHVWKSSGWTFAKVLERAEAIAEGHMTDPGAARTIMMQAMQKRIDNYFAELDA